MGEAIKPNKNFSCLLIKERMDKKPKKSFPVEYDPSTGDAFINLNGKKLKMVPEDAQGSAGPHKAPVFATIRLDPPTVAGQPLVIIPNKKKAPIKAKVVVGVKPDEKKYIKVKRDSLSAAKITDNVAEKPKTVDSTAGTTDGVTDKMQALDLSKINRTQSLNYPKSDNSSQTDVKQYKDMGVQVPDAMSEILKKDVFLGGILDDIDFSDILEPRSPYDVLQDKRATDFFHDLRAALQPDDKGNMPIHIAVIKNSLPMLKKSSFILRTLKQPIDIANSNGFTALQLAITTNASKDLITFLLDNNARLDVHDSDGNNVLHLAFEYRREDAMSTLLDHSDKYNVINEHNHEGMTPLMIGAINSLQGCVEILLDYGAAIDLRDQISGRTALFHAAENQDMEMVKLLLHYNANTKIKNFFGTSPHDAMYEIEETPGVIKHMILGRNLKRKQFEEQLPMTRPVKLHRSEPRIKTYSKEKMKIETSVSDVIL